MEFHEKLQELRKSRNLTQEELAQALYVSRTAISKWESGRGYPSIDSLKEIASFFSITIDDLLSSEKIITIAERENRDTIQNMCDILFGIVDLFMFILIILPLYPNTIDGYVYSVNLFNYIETTSFNCTMYWVMIISMIILGAIKIALTKLKFDRGHLLLMEVSLILNSILVLFFGLTREPYAITLAFLLLIVKGLLLLKYIKIR